MKIPKIEGQHYSLPKEERDVTDEELARAREAGEGVREWERVMDDISAYALDHEMGRHGDGEPEIESVFQRFFKQRRKIGGMVLATVLAGLTLESDRGSEDVRRDGVQVEQRVDEAVHVDLVEEMDPREAHFRELFVKKIDKFLEEFPKVAEEPYAEDLMVMLCTRYSTGSFRYFSLFENQPYADNVYRAMIDHDPTLVAKIQEWSEQPEDYGDGPKILEVFVRQMDDVRGDYYRYLLDSDFSKEEKRLYVALTPIAIEDGMGPRELHEYALDTERITDGLFRVAVSDAPEKLTSMAEAFLEDHFKTIVARMNNDRLIESDDEDEEEDPPSVSDVAFSEIRGATRHELYGMMALAGEDARVGVSQKLIDRLLSRLKKDGVSFDEFVDSMDGYGYVPFVTRAGLVRKLSKVIDSVEKKDSESEVIERMFTYFDEGNVEENITHVSQLMIFMKDSRARGHVGDGLKRHYLAAVESGDDSRRLAFGYLSALYGEKAREWLGDEFERFEIRTSETLSMDTLYDDKKRSVQVSHFYGGLDNKRDSSYGNVRRWHRSDSRFIETDHPTFSEWRAELEDGRVIVRYANKPWKEGGQDDIVDYMKERGESASVQIHRDHSFDVSNTLRYLNEDTRLFYNGGCGGVDIIGLARVAAPYAELVYNSALGNPVVNARVIRDFGERIFADEDIVWDGVERRVDGWIDRGGHSEEREEQFRDRFKDYIFPHDPRSAGTQIVAAYERGMEKVEFGDFDVFGSAPLESGGDE